MNTRIKTVRQGNNLTQAQFADSIGLSRNYVAMIEIGQREPSDRTISDICRIFNVEEDWLRYGVGPMRVSRSDDEEIAAMVASVLNGSDNFKKAVIRMICTRTPEQLQVLEDSLLAICESL